MKIFAIHLETKHLQNPGRSRRLLLPTPSCQCRWHKAVRKISPRLCRPTGAALRPHPGPLACLGVSWQLADPAGAWQVALLQASGLAITGLLHALVWDRTWRAAAPEPALLMATDTKAKSKRASTHHSPPSALAASLLMLCPPKQITWRSYCRGIL